MKMKRTLSALLMGSVLFSTLPTAAAAAGDPVVEFEVLGQFAELVVKNLPADTQIHSAQVELTLDGLHYPEEIIPDPNNNYTDDSADPAKEITAATTLSSFQDDTKDKERTTITVYLDSPLRLDRDGILSLGTIKFQSEKTHKFNATGRLTLLDERQHPVPEKDLTVTVRERTADNNDNTGSTGGSSSGGSSHVQREPGSNSSSAPVEPTTYKVSTSKTSNGNVKLSPSNAEKGEKVTVTVTPDDGYELDSITVLDSRGREIELTDEGDGIFTFTMPGSAVTVEAAFKASANASAPAQMPFMDVATSDWYYSAVEYVYQKGMMSGTSSGAFSPNMSTNRAMIVSILHRLEGSPAAPASTFPDVTAGQYDTDAVAWAASNGIVSGYSNGQFKPNDIITREQFASILYRYAQYKGYPTAASADLSTFSDASAVSNYATESMRWAVSQNLISGTNRGTLDPAGGAARAQAASILMRFCQSFT